MERIGFTASEKKSFENVDGRRWTDGRRTTDACLYYKLIYERSAQVSWQFNAAILIFAWSVP